MSAAARVRHTVNGGKDSYSSRVGVSLDQSLEDRYQRVVAENHQLKLQRNELQEKVKDLTTKFRRLVRDLKLGVDVDALMAAPSPRGGPTTGEGDRRSPPKQHASLDGTLHKQSASFDKPTAAMVDALTKERDFFREQARQLQLSSTQGTGAAMSIDDRVRSHESNAAQFFDKQRLDQALKEVARLQGLLQAEMNQRMELQQQAGAHHAQQHGHQHTAAAAHRDDELRGLRVQLQQQQQDLLQAKSNIEHLTRERDTIQMQLRLAKEVQGEASSMYGGSGVVLDSMSLLELQQDIQNRVSQITVLSNRLTYAQNQVGTFKQECERLVNELRLLHGQLAEVKKQLFEQEHEKASLALKCERLSEVELALHHKQDELLKTEQQLLRMVEKMQSVGRDTEMSVRREVATRLAEAEQSRDEAERLRRSKEQVLYDTEQEVTELRRKTNLLQEALEHAKKELAKETEDRKELAARNAILSGVSGDLGEDIHKAVALATMRQRVQQGGGGGVKDGVHPGDGILNLWEGLEWNEGWEAAKLRETMAASALDLELADTRVGQLTAQLQECGTSLKAIATERDTLLDENSTLRRRISGVQTSLAKRQLARYRRQMAANAPHSGTLTIRFKSLRSAAPTVDTDGAGRDDGGDGTAGSSSGGVYFLTLDHVLPSYETLVSSVFHNLNDDALDVLFEFRDVHLDEATVASLRNATFDVQLHKCGSDNTSTIVGYAEWPAARLMSSDGGCIFDVVVDLVAPNSGACVAQCVMDVDSENLMLPVLLGAPLSSVMLDPERVNALLYKLRSVVAIRIQVFEVSDIPSTTTAPYVFYTCAMVDGVAPVVDTTVEPLAGGRALMQRIHAAAAAQQGGTTAATAAASPNSAVGGGLSLPFDHDPKDHAIVLDRRNIHSIAEGVMVFVLFDRTASNVQEHVAILQVPLRPLLESPQAAIVVKEAMQPTCAIELGISWVHGVQ